MDLKCKCGKPAVWMYMLDTHGYEDDALCCNDCVPRDTCSCNVENKEDILGDSIKINDRYYPIDDKGRLYPCVDWSKIE